MLARLVALLLVAPIPAQTTIVVSRAPGGAFDGVHHTSLSGDGELVAGVRPRKLASCAALGKRFRSSTSATIVAAVSVLMPLKGA
jgi:hypothetical protein